jgi:hypothetical protein
MIIRGLKSKATFTESLRDSGKYFIANVQTLEGGILSPGKRCESAVISNFI